MSTVSDLIRQSDPLGHEPMWSPQVRQGVRQRVLQGCADAAPSIHVFRQRVAVAVLTMCLMFVAAAIIPRVWEPPVQAQASVRFEIRLAEDSPAPGLQPVTTGIGSTIYLHRDAVIGNIDIATARVATRSPAGFSVDVTFTPQGAERISRATSNHVGKSVAILVDGHVVAVPRLRSASRSSAEINGDFTRADAERIANGMIGR